MNFNKLFEGRLRRVDFLIGGFITSLVFGLLSNIPYISIVLLIVGLLISYSMTVRRAHDFNQGILMPVIFIILSFISIILSMLPVSFAINNFIVIGISIITGLASLILCLIFLFAKDKNDNKYGKVKSFKKLYQIFFGNLFEKEGNQSEHKDVVETTKE